MRLFDYSENPAFFNFVFCYFFLPKFIKYDMAQSAEVVEYTDCFSAEG